MKQPGTREKARDGDIKRGADRKDEDKIYGVCWYKREKQPNVR